MSRLYYAVYAACCAWLDACGVSQDPAPDGGSWYPHRRLRDLIEGTAESWRCFGEELLADDDVEEIKDAILRLFKARIDADYAPWIPFDPDDLSELTRDALRIVTMLDALSRGDNG